MRIPDRARFDMESSISFTNVVYGDFEKTPNPNATCESLFLPYHFAFFPPRFHSPTSCKVFLRICRENTKSKCHSWKLVFTFSFRIVSAKGPQESPRDAQEAIRSSQESPKRSQEASKSQELPRTFQELPRSSQGPPKSSQGAPKELPRSSQETPGII